MVMYCIQWPMEQLLRQSGFFNVAKNELNYVASMKPSPNPDKNESKYTLKTLPIPSLDNPLWNSIFDTRAQNKENRTEQKRR